MKLMRNNNFILTTITEYLYKGVNHNRILNKSILIVDLIYFVNLFAIIKMYANEQVISTHGF